MGLSCCKQPAPSPEPVRRNSDRNSEIARENTCYTSSSKPYISTHQELWLKYIDTPSKAQHKDVLHRGIARDNTCYASSSKPVISTHHEPYLRHIDTPGKAHKDVLHRGIARYNTLYASSSKPNISTHQEPYLKHIDTPIKAYKDVLCRGIAREKTCFTSSSKPHISTHHKPCTKHIATPSKAHKDVLRTSNKIGGTRRTKTEGSKKIIKARRGTGRTKAEGSKKIIKEQRENFRLNNQIDLHGLFVKEARALIEQLLSQRVKELRFSKSSTTSDVIVITGKGIHSDDGVAKLRPAIKSFLTNKGYSYEEVENNHGRLLVHL